MENEEVFLEKLVALFLSHGAKSLTMDDIAKYFSVSKKTLYQAYNNKETLLIKVLSFVTNQVLDGFKKIEENSTNAIEILFNRNQLINESIGPEKNAFINQLIKYYPDVYKNHILNVHSKVLVLLKENYIKGKEENFYRENIDIESYVNFYMVLNFSLDASPLYEENTFEEKITLCNSALYFYLDAIVTENGRKHLNLLKIKYEELV